MKPVLVAVSVIFMGGLVGMASTKKSSPPSADLTWLDRALASFLTPTPEPTPLDGTSTPTPLTPSPTSPPSTPLPPSHWECEWGTPPETGRCTSLSHQQEAFSAFSAFVGRSVGKITSQNRSEDVVCRGECAAVFRMNDPVDMLAKAVEGNGKETSIFMIGDSTVRKMYNRLVGSLPKHVAAREKHSTISWSYVKQREFALRARLRVAFVWLTGPLLPKRTIDEAAEVLGSKQDITIYSTGLWALWKPTYERALMLACTFREDAQVALTRLSAHSKSLYVLGADSVCPQNLKTDFFKEMPERWEMCKSKDLCKASWALRAKNNYVAPSTLWAEEHGVPDKRPTPPECKKCHDMCKKATFTAKGSAYISKHLQSAFNKVKANNSHYVDMTTVTRNAGCDFCSDGVHHEHIVLDTKLSLLVHHIFINSNVKAAAGKTLYGW